MEIERSKAIFPLFYPCIHVAVRARTHYIDCSRQHRLRKLDGAAAATIEAMDL